MRSELLFGEFDLDAARDVLRELACKFIFIIITVGGLMEGEGEEGE